MLARAGSETKADSLRMILPFVSDDKKVNILQDLTFFHLFRTADTCVEYGKQTIELARKTGDKQNEALANKRIGYAFYRMGEFDSSLIYYEKAIQLYTNNKDFLSAAVVTNFAGDAYTRQGWYDKAIRYFIKAEQNCDTLVHNDSLQTSVKRLYAILYTNMGLLYFDLDSLDKPVHYFEKALQYAGKIGDSTRMVAAYSNLGMTYKAKQQYDIALKMYITALKTARKIGNRDYQSAILNNIANIHSIQMHYDSAMRYYKLAQLILKENDDKYGLSLLSRNIASTYLNLKKVDTALHHIQNALIYAKETGSGKELYNNYLVLSDIYDQMGLSDLAFWYYKRYAELRDSVTGQETRETIAKVQTKYQTAKKEKENITLRKENEIHQLKLEKNQITIFSLTAGIAVILILFSVVFFQYRGKYIAYRKLVKKNIEILHVEDQLQFAGRVTSSEEKTAPGPNTGSLPDPRVVEITQKLEKFMREEKPYFDSNISIDEVSKKLSTNRTYLASAIKEKYSQSFNTFINHFRIKEAMRLLLDPAYAHLSIEGIGQIAGFNTKMAFYTNFKKITGVTPMIFRKNAKP